MRKRRTQGQQAAASGAFLWVFVYAFRTLFRRGLDNPIATPSIVHQKPAAAGLSAA